MTDFFTHLFKYENSLSDPDLNLKTRVPDLMPKVWDTCDPDPQQRPKFKTVDSFFGSIWFVNSRFHLHGFEKRN
jgi:hypothetical protein